MRLGHPDLHLDRQNASEGVLWPAVGHPVCGAWQKTDAVIQCHHGTGWEADDRKGLGCHRLRAVAFSVLPPLSSFKNQRSLFSVILEWVLKKRSDGVLYCSDKCSVSLL